MIATLFFYASKLLWSLLAPDALLLYLLLGACLCLWRGWQRAARWLLTIVTVGTLTLAFLPIGVWLLHPLERRFAANPPLPEQVDGIVVLGGSINALESYEWNQVQLNNAAERNVAFVELARRYPSAKLLMSGGNGSPGSQQFREADVARELFATLGVDVARIEFERDSRNSWENVSYSKTLMSPQPGETWILITSAAHMPRAVGLFCAQGWPVLPWPVDHQTAASILLRLRLNLANNLVGLNWALHEWAGLIVYYASGKIGSPLPTTCLTEE